MARPTKSTVDSLKNWILDIKGDMEEAGYKGFKVIDHVEGGSHVHHTEHHIFRLPKRYAIINIDELVSGVIGKSGVYDGFLFVASMHTTSAVVVTDQSQGLLHDIARVFTDLAPYGADAYEHHKSAEQPNTDNGDAIIKTLLVHQGAHIPITKGRADIGPDQYPFYAEFDGKKDKRIIMKVTGLKRPDGVAEQKQGNAAAQQQATAPAPAAAAAGGGGGGGGGGAAAPSEKKAFRTYD